jgi:hypothetical protein
MYNPYRGENLEGGKRVRINWTRVILGGVLAGLIINICEFLVNGLILRDEWARAMAALNQPAQMALGATVAFWMWGFLIGLFALWLYVTIRPRFGPGPKTAVIAGIAVWIPGSLLAMIAPAALHLFRYRLIVIGVALALVEIALGTVAGASFYKGRETKPAASSQA